jgi:hypothetical protein
MIQRRLYRLWSFVLVLSLLVVLAVRNDEVDASLLEPLAQRIGVVGALGDRAFRLYSRPTFGARNLDFGERGFRKRNFSRRATFEPNSQRKTAAVDQYHPLCALATLGFTDCRAPLFRRSEAAVQERLLRFQQSFAVQDSKQRPPRVKQDTLLFPMFQAPPQVAGEGSWSGKNLQAAPVCSTTESPPNRPGSTPRAGPQLETSA